MKKILFLFVLTIAFISCKNETKNGDPEVMVPDHADIMESDVNSPETACYRFASSKDTVLLQIEKINNDVAGTLSYSYFEKDKNSGTFEGKMFGDTLYADYTFKSEGTTSIRQVMFIQKGNTFVEGYGNVEEVDGKMKFKDNTNFTLNHTMALVEVSCIEN